MTALWTSLDSDQHAAITCALTLLAGLFLGAALVMRLMRRDTQQRAARDAEDAYLIAYAEAFDAIDWSNEVWAELDREAS